MEVLNRSHTNACTDSNGGKAAPHFIKTCKNRCFTKKEKVRALLMFFSQISQNPKHQMSRPKTGFP